MYELAEPVHRLPTKVLSRRINFEPNIIKQKFNPLLARIPQKNQYGLK